jgi:REP element-mobilizing transposase RayT
VFKIDRPERDGAGSAFFVTLSTPGRQPWLERPRTRDVFMSVLRAWHMERNGRVLAAVVMYDHAHVLLEPGSAATPLQLVARWKSAMRRGAGYAETFDDHSRGHKLHPGESREEYALYMFLHPYRAGLAAPNEAWPGWWLPDPSLFKFAASLDANGVPTAELLAWPDACFAGLQHGE